MELWVRSQDKMSLVNVNCVQYVCIESINEHCIIGSGVDLGIYTNKERCLEILDEIQKILMADPIPLLTFTNCDVSEDTYNGLNEMYKKGNLLALCTSTSEENIKVIEKSTVVYEMPEK